MDQKLNLITEMLHRLVSSHQGDQGNNRSSQKGNSINSDLFLPNNTLPTYEQLTVPGRNEDDISWCGKSWVGFFPPFSFKWNLEGNSVHQTSEKTHDCNIYTTGLKCTLLKPLVIAQGLTGCVLPGKTYQSSTLILLMNKNYSNSLLLRKTETMLKADKIAKI